MRKEAILDTARNLLVERGATYGDVKTNFARISAVATGMLGRYVAPYEVAVVLAAVKLGRISEDPSYLDSWPDAVNYIAIAGEMATEPKE